MEIWERDIVKTLIDKDGIPKGSEGVVVSIYTGYPVCEVEIWKEDRPIDVVTYYFNELELVKRTKDAIELHNDELWFTNFVIDNY